MCVCVCVCACVTMICVCKNVYSNLQYDLLLLTHVEIIDLDAFYKHFIHERLAIKRVMGRVCAIVHCRCT